MVHARQSQYGSFIPFKAYHDLASSFPSNSTKAFIALSKVVLTSKAPTYTEGTYVSQNTVFNVAKNDGGELEEEELEEAELEVLEDVFDDETNTTSSSSSFSLLSSFLILFFGWRSTSEGKLKSCTSAPLLFLLLLLLLLLL